MSLTLNGSIAALGTLRQLSAATDRLTEIFERLSTGLRINGAKDDAAALSLMSGLESEKRRYSAAVRNVNDAISLLNIVDGALAQLTDITQKQKELAARAANYTALSKEQRIAINTEIKALSSEFNRIAEGVKYGGIQVLDPATGQITIQAGIDGSAESRIAFELAQELQRDIGTGTFASPVSYAVGSQPSSMLTADFDKDGILDLAVTNGTDGTVSILLGNGDGTFKAQQVFTAADYEPNSIIVGDLNGDGNLDLVAANYGNFGLGDSISIFLGNGNGTFQAVQSIPTGLGTTAITMADINNDGVLDVTIGSSGMNFVSGSPEFTRVTLPTQGTYEVNDITLLAAPVQEVTSVTAIPANDGTAEVTTIITGGIGAAEETTFTMTNIAATETTQITTGALGYRETTELTFAAPAVREVSTITSAGAKEVSSISAAAMSSREVTTITADAIGLSAEVTDITVSDGSSITSGDYFTLNSPSGQFYVWYNVDAGGGDPTPGGTGIEVQILSTDSADDVAAATQAAIAAAAEFSATVAGATVTVTNSYKGDVTAAADGGSGNFAITVTTQGADSDITNGSYFDIYDENDNHYYVWFDIGGTGSDPTPGGYTAGIKVDVAWNDSAATVATNIAAALAAYGGGNIFAAASSSAEVTLTNLASGLVNDAGTGSISGANFAVVVSTQGSATGLNEDSYIELHAADGRHYCLYFDIGTEPVVGGVDEYISVAVDWGMSADDVAAAIQTAITGNVNADAHFAVSGSGSSRSITAKQIGDTTNISAVNTAAGFSVSTTLNGAASGILGDGLQRILLAEQDGTQYHIWFTLDAVGADPGSTANSIQVDLLSSDDADAIAAKINTAINATAGSAFSAAVLDNTVTITNVQGGAATDISDNIPLLATATQTQGSDNGPQNSEYFQISTGLTTYYVWYDFDGTAADPTPGGTGIKVDSSNGLSVNNDAAAVASAVYDALSNHAGFAADFHISQNLGLLTFTTKIAETATDASILGGGAASVNITQQGAASDLQEGDYFSIESAGGRYYAWFNFNGSTANPAPGGFVGGIEVSVNWGMTANQVAVAIDAALNTHADFQTETAVVGNVATIETVLPGNFVDAAADNISGGAFSLATTAQGSDSANDIDAAFDYYFSFQTVSGPHETSTNGYYVWFNPEGTATDPIVAYPGILGGRTGIEVAVDWGDDAATVAAKVDAALTAAGITGAGHSLLGSNITISNDYRGAAVDATTNIGGATFNISIDTQGVSSDIDTGSYFTLYSPDAPGNPAQAHHFWFNISGDGAADPTPGGSGTAINVDPAYSANQVRDAIIAAVDGHARFSAVSGGAGTIVITNTDNGNAAAPSSTAIGSSVFNITTTSDGTGNTLQPGNYFLINDHTGAAWQIWFQVDGFGTDPNVAANKVLVNVNTSDTADQVADAIRTAISSHGTAGTLFTVDSTAGIDPTVEITNVKGGVTTNAVAGNTGFVVTTSVEGVNSIFEAGDYFTFTARNSSLNPTSYYVWFNWGGLEVDPAPGGTGIEINLAYGSSAAAIATAVINQINAVAGADVTASDQGGGVVRITGDYVGTAAAGAGTVSGMTIANIVDGVNPPIQSGQGFNFYALDGVGGSQEYYVWFNVAGGGGNPGWPGIAIEVAVSYGQTAATIRSNTVAAILAAAGAHVDIIDQSGGQFTIRGDYNGDAPNPTTNTAGGTIVTTLANGTIVTLDPVTDQISLPNHGRATGDSVELETDGTLPAPLATGTTYYLIVDDASNIRLATSYANALADIHIDITSFGSGTHTVVLPGSSTFAAFLLGNGDATFGGSAPFAVGQAPQFYQTADLNGDGFQDVLIAERATSSLEVHLATGSGGFSKLGNFAVPGAPSHFAIGDVNGDLIDDVIISNFDNGGGSSVSVLLGTGSGNFQSAVSYATGSGPKTVALGDLNNDGQLDIITSNFGNGAGNTASVLLGNGDGTFSNAGSINTGTGAVFGVVGDFNGDGVRDYAAANQTDGTVTVALAETRPAVGVAHYNIVSEEAAQAALTEINGTLERLGRERGSVGAVLSRLTYALQHADESQHLRTAAIDRIAAVDTAEEVARMIRTQILKQAMIAVLAHNRLQSGLALKLLQDI